MQLSDYLFFTTACEQALAFYAQCGLGCVVEVMRYGVDGMPVTSEGMRGKVMHAKFEGPGVLFYASDNDDAEPMRGSAHILMMDGRLQTEHLSAALRTAAQSPHRWGCSPGAITTAS